MKYFLSTLAAVVVVLIGTSFIVSNNSVGEDSSITKGGLLSANQATTTDDWGAVTVGGATPSKVIKGTAGILSAVCVNNETVGGYTLYNGTTTNHGDYATSSVWHFNIYPSMAEGCYPVEISFNKGLIAVFTSTNIGSSTILTQ